METQHLMSSKTGTENPYATKKEPILRNKIIPKQKGELEPTFLDQVETNQGIDTHIRHLRQKEQSQEAMQEFKSKLREMFEENSYKQQIMLEGLKPNQIGLSTDGTIMVAQMKSNAIGVYKKQQSGHGFNLIQTLEGHTGKVNSVSISSYGDTIVSGSGDKTVKVWVRRQDQHGKEPYKLIHTFEGHTSEVLSVAVSQDARTIVSGSEDKTIRIWTKTLDETPKYKHIQTLEGHRGYVTSVSLSADASTIVSGSWDKNTMIWIRNQTKGNGEPGWAAYERLQVLEGHSGWVLSVTVTPDGRYIASGSADKSAIVWKKEDGPEVSYTLIEVLDEFANQVNSVTLCPEGKTLVAGLADKTLRVLMRKGEASTTFTPLQNISGHRNTVLSVRVSQDTSKIYSASKDGTVRIWSRKEDRDLYSPNDPQILKGHSENVTCLSATPNGKVVVSGSSDNNVVIWLEDDTIKGYKLHQTLEGHSGTVNSVSLDPDGRIIVSASHDKTLKIWIRDADSMDFKLNQTLDGHKLWVQSVCISADASTIFSSSSNKKLKIWVKEQFTPNYNLLQTINDLPSSAFDISATPNGGTLIAGLGGNTARIWVKDEEIVQDPYKMLQVLVGHTQKVVSVDISEDSKTVITGSSDNTVRIWMRGSAGPASLFKQIQAIEDHSATVGTVMLSKDKNTLISGARDKTVKIWKRDGYQFALHSSLECDDSFSEAVFLKNVLIFPKSGNLLVVPHSFNQSFFGLISTNFYYSSLFLNSLSKESDLQILTNFLDGVPGFEAAQKERNRIELFRLHHGLNPLFWCCLFQSPDLLRKSLEKWGYEQWVYSESPGFDPFLYSMKIENQELIEVFADYFLEGSNSKRLTIRDHKHLELLLSSKSAKVQKLAIHKFKGSSILIPGVEPIKLCGFDKDHGYISSQSKNPFVDSGAKNELKGKEDHHTLAGEVAHESTFIPIPVDLSRLFSFIKSIKEMTPENKLSLRPLILALYIRYKKFFIGYSVLNLMATVILFTTIAYQWHRWYTLVPFYIIYTGMLVFEVIDMATKRTEYFKSIFNIFDVILYPLGMGLTAYVVIEGYEFLENERENFLSSLVLYLALLRAVSMLRVLDSTRYLILMILKVYSDMTPFLIVLLGQGVSGS